MKPVVCSLFVSSFLLLVAGCKKNDSFQQSNSSGSTLDKAVYHNLSDSTTDTSFYMYDSQNRLTGIVHNNTGNNDPDKETFEYDNQGRYSGYTSTTANLSGDIYNFRADFVYDINGNIVKAKLTSGGENLGSLSYAYDSRGNIIADSTYNPNYSLTKVYLYDAYAYDANDNIIRLDEYIVVGNSFNLTQTTNLTYDNKMNPYYAIGKLLFLPVNGENIMYLTKSNIAGETFSTSSFNYNYSYTYNSNGFPETANFDDPNSYVAYFYK